MPLAYTSKSNKALAERMGVDRNLVNSVEMGKRRVPRRTVQIFADGLGVSPSDLVQVVAKRSRKSGFQDFGSPTPRRLARPPTYDEFPHVQQAGHYAVPGPLAGMCRRRADTPR
ncbi:helix-turn-helix domain-containing protein [Burkholderia gladioli]|uniref:helix-turn-helix domain-containing protein n=1 Tax=Burkholderia gladioli TaxID=28095 RepID=UPI00163F9E84